MSQNVCHVCKRPGISMTCGLCKKRRYCSRKCVSIDWNRDHYRYCPVVIANDQQEQQEAQIQQEMIGTEFACNLNLALKINTSKTMAGGVQEIQPDVVRTLKNIEYMIEEDSKMRVLIMASNLTKPGTKCDQSAAQMALLAQTYGFLDPNYAESASIATYGLVAGLLAKKTGTIGDKRAIPILEYANQKTSDFSIPAATFSTRIPSRDIEGKVYTIYIPLEKGLIQGSELPGDPDSEYSLSANVIEGRKTDGGKTAQFQGLLTLREFADGGSGPYYFRLPLVGELFVPDYTRGDDDGNSPFAMFAIKAYPAAGTSVRTLYISSVSLYYPAPRRSRTALTRTRSLKKINKVPLKFEA